MKHKYYAANAKEAMLQITTELGKGNLTIAIADKDLSWKDIKLDAEQTEGLMKFLNENVML